MSLAEFDSKDFFPLQLNGTAKPSFVSASLAQCDENSSDYADQIQMIQDTASMVYIGMFPNTRYGPRILNSLLPAAAETIVACNLTFIFAMLKFPSVQRRAQKEIDSVIRPDRLPDFSDVEHLPFVSAVMKEVLR